MQNNSSIRITLTVALRSTEHHAGQWVRLYRLTPYRARPQPRQQSAPPFDLPPVTVEQIRYRARRLAEKIPPCTADYEDIVQDLTVEVLHAMPRYDPARGSIGTFTRAVLDNAYRSQLRKARRRQELASFTSLDDQFDLADKGSLFEDAADVRIEVAHLLTLLPERQRHLALALMTGSVADYAAEVGVHRGTVYRWLSELRETLIPLLEEFRD